MVLIFYELFTTHPCPFYLSSISPACYNFFIPFYIVMFLFLSFHTKNLIIQFVTFFRAFLHLKVYMIFISLYKCNKHYLKIITSEKVCITVMVL